MMTAGRSAECGARVGFIEKNKSFGKKLFDVEKSIVTNGGVPLTEVDSKTMRSRLFSNLYFADGICRV